MKALIVIALLVVAGSAMRLSRNKREATTDTASTTVGTSGTVTHTQDMSTSGPSSQTMDVSTTAPTASTPPTTHSEIPDSTTKGTQSTLTEVTTPEATKQTGTTGVTTPEITKTTGATTPEVTQKTGTSTQAATASTTPAATQTTGVTTQDLTKSTGTTAETTATTADATKSSGTTPDATATTPEATQKPSTTPEATKSTGPTTKESSSKSPDTTPGTTETPAPCNTSVATQTHTYELTTSRETKTDVSTTGTQTATTAGQTETPTSISTGTPIPIDTSFGAKLISKLYKESINTSVDPCKNFFNYVCDGYNKRYPLNGTDRQGVNEALQDQVITNLTLSLKRAPEFRSKSDALSVNYTYNIFDTCSRAKQDDYRGAKAILNITKEYGGWPILDVNVSAWTSERLSRDLSWIIGSVFGVHGIATLITPNVGVDQKNIHQNILYLDQATLAMPAVYYRHPNYTQETKQSLRQRIASTVRALANRTDETRELDPESVKRQIDAMVEIDYELAMISTPDTENRNSTLQYNPYTVDKAEHEFDSFNWTKFFDGLTSANWTGDEPPTEKFDQKFILIQAKSYMPKLNEWLRNYTRDEKKMKDLVNYIVYRLVSPYMLFAGPALDSATHLREQVTRGHMKRPKTFGDLSLPTSFDSSSTSNGVSDHEKNCANFIMNMIPYVAGRLYVDSSFPEIARDDVALMVGNVLAAFKGMLSGLPWMDERSVLKAYFKIDSMIQNVAYPDFQQQDQTLDAYYTDLIKSIKDVNPDQYEAFFVYVRMLVAYQNREMFRQVLKSADRSDFLMSPAVVNDWYQPERNSITFPAAQLAPPFYGYDFPKAVNYGAFGATIGHEMTHGFDDEGIQYDWNGTLHTWMSDKSQVGFKNMAQCVVDEYNGFCYPQACVNGLNTQGENIADNGGLKASFQAYKAWSFSHGDEPHLPDFPNLNMDQIFFIAYGYSWCGQFDEEFLTRLLLTNVHSPYPERVNGVVMNFAEFGKAFQCASGDKLYPKKKCDVW